MPYIFCDIEGSWTSNIPLVCAEDAFVLFGTSRSHADRVEIAPKTRETTALVAKMSAPRQNKTKPQLSFVEKNRIDRFHFLQEEFLLQFYSHQMDTENDGTCFNASAKRIVMQ